MASSGGVAVIAPSPADSMASWSFYTGILGFIIAVASPLANFFPPAVPFILFAGLVFGVIAIVLGIIGLTSINRISALAGLIFGILTMVAFGLYIYRFSLIKLPI